MFFFIYVTHICMMYHEINVSENNVLTSWRYKSCGSWRNRDEKIDVMVNIMRKEEIKKMKVKKII